MGDVLLSKELLPCPFCGGEAELIYYRANGKTTVSCSVGGCMANISFCPSTEEAIKKWNRRADDASNMVR